jgi:hypothetical protein
VLWNFELPARTYSRARTVAAVMLGMMTGEAGLPRERGPIPARCLGMDLIGELVVRPQLAASSHAMPSAPRRRSPIKALA